MYNEIQEVAALSVDAADQQQVESECKESGQVAGQLSLVGGFVKTISLCILICLWIETVVMPPHQTEQLMVYMVPHT